MAAKRNIWEAFYVWRKTGKVIFLGSFTSRFKASDAIHALYLEMERDRSWFGAASLVYKNGEYRRGRSHPGDTPHDMRLCERLIESRGLYDSASSDRA